jgi:hypothetical protein
VEGAKKVRERNGAGKTAEKMNKKSPPRNGKIGGERANGGGAIEKGVAVDHGMELRSLPVEAGWGDP